jgi:hypothetical protein
MPMPVFSGHISYNLLTRLRLREACLTDSPGKKPSAENGTAVDNSVALPPRFSGEPSRMLLIYSQPRFRARHLPV